MDPSLIKNLLAAPPQGKIAVIGDFCVDVYWNLDPDAGEISIETGKKTTPVSSTGYTAGGAANIVANLRAMGLQKIPCSGAVGNDPFGFWLFGEMLSDTPEYVSAFMKICRKEFHTAVYCKPLLDGEEQSRVDLGNTPLTDDESVELLDRLEKFLPELNVVIVNGQLCNGIHRSPLFRTRFAEIVKRYEDKIKFVFDGRDYLDAYPGVTLKINADAASRLAFGVSGRTPEESGRKILERSGKELVVTDGAKGAYVFERDKISFIPAILFDGPVDTVGAGDSFTAGFAWALAAGASMDAAACLGTCCSAVTVRKIHETGVPYPHEILGLF